MCSRRILMLLPIALTGCLGTSPANTPEATNKNPSVYDAMYSTRAEVDDSVRMRTIRTGQQGGPTLPGGSSDDPANTFEHPDLVEDPFDVLTEIQELGIPEVTSRLHSCQKPKVATLGRMLQSLGVDLNNQAQLSAGRLYREGANALGAPNYRARIAESIEWTTSGATKALDIFVQAAPEVIAAMPSNPHCAIAGQPTSMFDAQGRCTVAGITCLQGTRTTQAQKDLCDATASEGEAGRLLAVASILAAAHTCE